MGTRHVPDQFCAYDPSLQNTSMLLMYRETTPLPVVDHVSYDNQLLYGSSEQRVTQRMRQIWARC